MIHRVAEQALVVTLLCCVLIENATCLRKYTKEDMIRLREEVRAMFQHAYDGYLRYANKYDELRPLSCDGVDTWGSYSLTLIDALDTLAVMGNYSEFRRVVKLLEKKSFDSDINVSVFETNIRIVGGLISSHMMSHKAGVELEPGWPCDGPLLRLAEDVAKRLLPAFDTRTGMPYGTVNLKYGVPYGETSVTCTAGIGTFIVEFGALSRLTGDPIYEEVALNALYALYDHRSSIGLFGNHIDVQTGRWTAQDAGIGAGVDSYYEYLVKGAIMLNKPDLMHMFNEGRKSIDKYLKRDDWHVWVSMNKGQVTLPVFQSLEAYWPGVLSLFGDTSVAMKTLHNYHTVWKQYGFLPEFYNIPNAEAGANRENYPLRPELIESVMYLYRATGDPYLLEVGEDILRSIEYSAKTPCGYATIKNVRDHHKEDRMESFFLAETTKYLYLLFDPDNFIHNDGRVGTVINTTHGECIIDAGGYIFNTEAHPIDPSMLRCCHELPQQDLLADYSKEKFAGDRLDLTKERDAQTEQKSMDGIKTENISVVEAQLEDSIPVAVLEELGAKLAEARQALTKKRLEEAFNKARQSLKNQQNDAAEEKDVNHTLAKDDSLVVPVNKPAEHITPNPTVSATEDPERMTTIKLTPSARDPDDKSSTAQLKSNNESQDERPNVSSHEDQVVESLAQADDEEEEDVSSPKKFFSENSSVEGENMAVAPKPSVATEHLQQPQGVNNTIAELVQNMFKTKVYQKTKFDPQVFLNKIKHKGQYRNASWATNYGLLTCRAQPFLQRITLLGEFY
ncbi:ER degradation-enhancing alpha-mannosidase-like protein 2 [Toxorhynchites rutilus septentrionalis]|uniref:ER degradation-enhancing alpha-mannosidase-like protein 2 n=1 Tax=Toxorhynchites rutilus septentrionalis TaxID=329112 RepID=UPI00247A83C0|nr:ER degradation-enhancing alpha-mannosidase-like protein 2 [Toxorhynchites rutilus septentrionalis]